MLSINANNKSSRVIIIAANTEYNKNLRTNFFILSYF